MTIDSRRKAILELVRELHKADSWCGETYIQKAIYFLKDLMGIDLGFPFVLYRYGPYSFELSDELAYLNALCILDSRDTAPYGSRYFEGTSSSLFESMVEDKVDEKTSRAITFLTQRIFSQKRTVAELERSATALYAKKNFTGDKAQLSKRIHEIKPHITESNALQALQEIDQFTEEVGG